MQCKHWLAAILLILLVFSAPSLAQQKADNVSTQSPRSICHIIRSDILASACDAGHVFSAPLRFGTTEWLVTGALIGSTVALFPADESIRTFFKRQHNKTLDGIMEVGRTYGSGVPTFAISGSLYLGGLVFNNEGVRLTGREVFESFVFAEMVTTSLKVLIGRSRPSTGEGAFRFRGFQFKAATTSLPSGHTTAAFALSSVLAARIDKTWPAIGLYGLAGLTAVSRIYHDAHWASDVFLGAVIGTAVGNTIVSRHDLRPKKSCWMIVPAPNGLNFRLSF
ncbi:MAG: phosphatase PAP2 family protein [candidate division KSB1 bacterium]|nr:phosphatase PAP2 family protein [candidate division KSB1 bacterium]MDZ7304480.1 phosphatase PAP2 family protein [candidate division KSB1 bacterium]MDZ7312987.1 phosphatase PAP2 family protein [candidate division KSB1 bacterium]